MEQPILITTEQLTAAFEKWYQHAKSTDHRFKSAFTTATSYAQYATARILKYVKECEEIILAMHEE